MTQFKKMDKDIQKTYSNEEVTVVWKPSLCKHSTICWKESTGLPAVFDPRKRPWITLDGAGTEAIVSQVKKCPSGALSFFNKSEKTKVPLEDVG